jgi:hypothetical protein
MSQIALRVLQCVQEAQTHLSTEQNAHTLRQTQSMYCFHFRFTLAEPDRAGLSQHPKTRQKDTSFKEREASRLKLTLTSNA